MKKLNRMYLTHMSLIVNALEIHNHIYNHQNDKLDDNRSHDNHYRIDTQIVHIYQQQYCIYNLVYIGIDSWHKLDNNLNFEYNQNLFDIETRYQENISCIAWKECSRNYKRIYQSCKKKLIDKKFVTEKYMAYAPALSFGIITPTIAIKFTINYITGKVIPVIIRSTITVVIDAYLVSSAIVRVFTMVSKRTFIFY